MLQKSVWISPLSIGEDMREFINSIGLSEYVFVMEIAGFILGDPRQLVRSVWSLERYEAECFRLKTKFENINQLLKNESDRISKNEAKRTRDNMGIKDYAKDYLNKLLRKKREIMRKRLEFIANFPALPWELLPMSLREFLSGRK